MIVIFIILMTIVLAGMAKNPGAALLFVGVLWIIVFVLIGLYAKDNPQIKEDLPSCTRKKKNSYNVNMGRMPYRQRRGFRGKFK